MARTIHALHDLQLRRWLSKGEAVAKSDGDGLTFTLSATGTATWVLRYRTKGGKRREITVGNYPDTSLASAREQARAMRAKIDAGIDPAAEKRQDKARSAAAWTMVDLLADYRKKVLTPERLAIDTIRYRNDDFNQVILPFFQSWEVRAITSVDVVHMLKSANRTWTISKRVLTAISQIMDHALGLTIISANPCTGIKLTALFGARPAVKKRVMLSTAELKIVLPTLDATIGRDNGLAFRILLATCVRGIELVKAQKAHLDLDAGTWWVPDESVKTRSGFLVPLAPPVVEWFRELVGMAGDSNYILPVRRADVLRRNGGDTHIGRTTLLAAVSRAFRRGQLDVRKFTIHDTRSTAKGHLRNLGFSNEISEIALNHTLKGMESIYDVREEIPERRIAMSAWADFVVACETGNSPRTPNNVIPMNRNRA